MINTGKKHLLFYHLMCKIGRTWPHLTTIQIATMAGAVGINSGICIKTTTNYTPWKTVQYIMSEIGCNDLDLVKNLDLIILGQRLYIAENILLAILYYHRTPDHSKLVSKLKINHPKFSNITKIVRNCANAALSINPEANIEKTMELGLDLAEAIHYNRIRSDHMVSRFLFIDTLYTAYTTRKKTPLDMESFFNTIRCKRLPDIEKEGVRVLKYTGPRYGISVSGAKGLKMFLDGLNRVGQA